MATIRVNPGILSSSAANIIGSAGGITNAGNNANSAAHSAPDYNGQFGPKVRSIGLEALSIGRNNSTRLTDHAGYLNNKAAIFSNVDNSYKPQGQVLGATTESSGGFWSLINFPNLILERIRRLLGLGNLPSGSSNVPTGTIATNPTKVVISNSINFRAAAGMNGKVLALLKPNSEFTILDDQVVHQDGHDWVRVQLPNGQIGWVALDVIKEKKEQPNPSSNITPTPGSSQSIGLKQNGGDWGDDPMGKDNQKIKDVGCLITNVALIGRFYGFNITPKDVNNYLRANNGYGSFNDPDDSNMKIGVAQEFLNHVSGKSFSINKDALSKNDVNSLIQAGNPVIIHVQSSDLKNGHWVLATGIDKNGDYSVIDPLTGGPSTYSSDKLLTGHKSFAMNK